MNKALLSLATLLLSSVSLLAGDPHFVAVDWETFFCKPTADNVNVRTAPGVNAPIATDQYGNRLTVCTTRRLVGRYSPIDRDWVEIFHGATYDQTKSLFVSAKYICPEMTVGFPKPAPNSTQFSIGCCHIMPDDDETGCWQPEVNVFYIYDNGICLDVSTGFNNIFRFGHLQEDIVYWDGSITTVEFADNRDNPGSLSVDLITDPEWPRMKISTGKNASLSGQKLVPSDYFFEAPDFSLMRGEQIEKMLEDAKAKGLVEAAGDYDITIVEDIEDRNRQTDFTDTKTRTFNN